MCCSYLGQLGSIMGEVGSKAVCFGAEDATLEFIGKLSPLSQCVRLIQIATHSFVLPARDRLPLCISPMASEKFSSLLRQNSTIQAASDRLDRCPLTQGNDPCRLVIREQTCLFLVSIHPPTQHSHLASERAMLHLRRLRNELVELQQGAGPAGITLLEADDLKW